MWARGVGRPFSLFDPAVQSAFGSHRHIHREAAAAAAHHARSGRPGSGDSPRNRDGGVSRYPPKKRIQPGVQAPSRKPGPLVAEWVREAEDEGKPLQPHKRRQMEYEERQRTPRWTPESLQHDPARPDPWWKKRRQEQLDKRAGGPPKLLAAASGQSGPPALPAPAGSAASGLVAAPAAPSHLQELRQTYMGASREKLMLKQRQLQDGRDANAFSQLYEKPPMLEETVLLWSGGALTRAEWFNNRVGQDPSAPQTVAPIGDLGSAPWCENPEQELYFVDCTVGSGGHTEHLLETYPNSRVLCIDMDAESLVQVYKRLAPRFGDRIRLHHGSFSDLCIPDDGISPQFEVHSWDPSAAGGEDSAAAPAAENPASLPIVANALAAANELVDVPALALMASVAESQAPVRRLWTRTADLSSHSSLTFTLGPHSRSMLLRRLGWPDKVQGLLVDTGPSVAQSTCRWRGFSIFSDKGIDMRYDLPPASHMPSKVKPKRPRRGSNIDGRLTAADLLNTAEYWELERVFRVLDGVPVSAGAHIDPESPNASALKHGRDGVLCGALPMILTRLVQIHREGVPDTRCPDTKRVAPRTIDSAVELTTLIQSGLEALHNYFFLPPDDSEQSLFGNPTSQGFGRRGFRIPPKKAASLLVCPAGRREGSGDFIDDLRSLSREEVMSVPEWMLVCRKEVFARDIRGRPLPSDGRAREIRRAIEHKSEFRLVAASAFSALRRAVNRELDHLAQIIRCAPQLLSQHGSMVVITGTRIEDAVVLDGLHSLTSHGSAAVSELAEQQQLARRTIHSTIQENAILDWSTVPQIVMPPLSLVGSSASFADHGSFDPSEVKALDQAKWLQSDLLPELEQPLELETTADLDGFDASRDQGLVPAPGLSKPLHNPESDPVAFAFLVGEREPEALRPKKADRLLSRSRLRVSRLRAVRRIIAPVSAGPDAKKPVQDDTLAALRRRPGLFGQASGGAAAVAALPSR